MGNHAVVDYLFLLAVGALGWGLSLATYRELAQRIGWPMGALQAERPAIPIGLGVFSLVAAIGFAMARGAASDLGWVDCPFRTVACAVLERISSRRRPERRCCWRRSRRAPLLVGWLFA